MCVVATVAYRVEMMTTLKIRKICFSPEVPIQPRRPMSDPAPPEVIQHSSSENSPI